MNIILEAKLSLDSIDPRLFYVILTLLVFAVVYAVKKFDKDRREVSQGTAAFRHAGQSAQIDRPRHQRDADPVAAHQAG